MSKQGFIYVLAHKGVHKDVVKIGESADPKERTRHANIFDPDHKFYLSSAILVTDAQRVEKDVHRALKPYRRGSTEFFEVEPTMAWIVAKAVAGKRLLADGEAVPRTFA